MRDRFNSVIKLACNPSFQWFLENGWTNPINVEITPSADCNAKCPNCLYANSGLSGKIDKALALNLISQIEEAGVESITWSGCGEPSLHPDIGEFIEKAASLCIKQGMFTNALLPPAYDPSNLEWIRVTVVPGEDLPVDNLRSLREAKILGLCVNTQKDSAKGEIERAIVAAEEVAVDYVHVRPNLSLGGKFDLPVNPGIKHELIRYDSDKFDVSPRKDYRLCRGFHFAPFVWHDGIVSVCAYMKDHPDCILGDLNQESFYDIVKKFPSAVFVKSDCMAFCKNNEINSFIDKALTIDNKEFV